MHPASRSPTRRIVAATEGSPHGDYAATVARAIAAATGAELVVLCVVAQGEAPPPIAGQWTATASGGAPTAVAERVRVEVLAGHPSIEIVHGAERLKASLLVIGRRPAAELGDAMLGPTADQVVRRSSIPCLVIPDGAWRDHPRILAAVDGTERGVAVLRGATRVAELCCGSMRAVTVLGAPPIGGVAEWPKDRGRRRADARPDPPVLLRHGDPVDEVLAEAGSGVDVVAVGMRRLGQPDSSLERGIARRVLRRATGAVLTIPL